MDDNNPLHLAAGLATIPPSAQSNLVQAKQVPSLRQATASSDPSQNVNPSRLWWVAQSRPQYEQRLVEDIAAYLKKRELDGLAFAPREEFIRSREDADGHFHHDRRTRLIFPGYVMYHGDRDAAFESPALLKVLNTSQADCRDIDNLLLAYEAGPVRRATSDLMGIRAGLTVKVVSGPFMGTVGQVERFGDTRIVLLVGTLGGAEITTELKHIEPFIGD
jgi:transcription antitermination factor NusG